MKELDDLLAVFKRVFINKGSFYVFFILFIMFVMVYLRNNIGLFNHLEHELEEEDPDLKGENKKKVDSIFNTYCKDLVDSISGHIKTHNQVVIILINVLRIFLIYLIVAGLFTYLFVPRLKNSENCNLKRLYKYGFEYLLVPVFLIGPVFTLLNVLTMGSLSYLKIFITAKLGNFFEFDLFAKEQYNNWLLTGILLTVPPGYMLQKNKNITEILRFNHTGPLSKYVSNFVYLFITMLFFIYLFLNIYLTSRLSKNSCYILKNLQKRNLLKDKYTEITKEIRNAVVKKNSLATNNLVVMIVVLILYGFYTDVFNGFIEFFKSGSGHIGRISASMTCDK